MLIDVIDGSLGNRLNTTNRIPSVVRGRHFTVDYIIIV